MRRTKILRWMAGSLLFAIFLLILASPARAFEPRAGDKVTVEAGEVIEDDLYATANTIEVMGTIKGDLVAAGSLIIIDETGVVEGDLIAGGQGVVINGTVNDDVRIAGAVLAIGEKAKVASDLIAFGYSLTISQGAEIGQDLVFFGSQVLLSGEVARNAKIGTGGLQLNGKIGGNVDAEVGGLEDVMPFSPLSFMPPVPGIPQVPTIAGGLNMGKDSQIGGSLRYTGPQEAKIPQGNVNGKVTYSPPPPSTKGEKAAEAKPPTTAAKVLAWFFKFLRELVTLFLVGLGMVYLLPGLLEKGSAMIKTKPWHSLLWGIVAYVAFFFAIMLVVAIVVLLMVILGVVTLGGLMGTIFGLGVVTISSLSVGFHIAVSYLAKILVSFLLGALIFTRAAQGRDVNRLLPLVVGLLIIVFLASIPILGIIVNIVVVLLGLGAMWLLCQEWWNRRAKVVETSTPDLSPAD